MTSAHALRPHSHAISTTEPTPTRWSPSPMFLLLSVSPTSLPNGRGGGFRRGAKEQHARREQWIDAPGRNRTSETFPPGFRAVPRRSCRGRLRGGDADNGDESRVRVLTGRGPRK